MVISRKNRDSGKVEKSTWVLVIGAALTSLAIDRKAFDPFNTIKLIFIIVISSWLAGHLVDSYRKESPLRNSKDFLVLTLCSLFVIALGVSAYFSEIKVLALVGDSFRRNGLLQYLALVVVFLFASKKIDLKETSKIYKVSTLTAILMGGYGLIQISGNDFFTWNNPYNSMISTVGNPNFASAILAIFFLISFSSLLITDFPSKFKFLAILSLFISFIAIVLSDSRQGLVSIAIGLLFYSSSYIYFKKPKIRVFIILISICIAFAGIMGMLQKGPLVNLLYKESVSVRGFYWRAGIEMFLNNPLTGVGLDNYGAHFKEYRELAYPLRYGFNITSSNAHNTIIQLFATGGLFVGLTYLIILIFVLFTGIKLLKKSKGEDQKLVLGLVSAWLAFQAQTVISIDNIGVSVWGWLLGGSIVGISRNYEQFQTRGKIGKARVKQNSIPVLQPILSTILLIPALVISFQLLQAERDLLIARNFLDATAPQNKSTVESFSKEVLDNPFAINFYKLQSATYIYEMGDAKTGSEKIKMLYDQDPNNLDILYAKLAVETFAGDTKNQIMTRSKIAMQDPWNVENYYELLLLNEQLKRFDEVDKYGNIIMKIAPNSESAKKVIEMKVSS